MKHKGIILLFLLVLALLMFSGCAHRYDRTYTPDRNNYACLIMAQMVSIGIGFYTDNNIGTPNNNNPNRNINNNLNQ